MSVIYRSIEAEIPSLRRYARALVYDHSAADDLVQDCLARALDKVHLWQQGTNLRAWLFTILHNQHVDQIRLQVRMGTTLDIEDADPFLSRRGDQEKCVELRDLEKALGQLPEAQRAAILLIGLEGLSYRKQADQQENCGQGERECHFAISPDAVDQRRHQEQERHPGIEELYHCAATVGLGVRRNDIPTKARSTNGWGCNKAHGASHDQHSYL